MDVIERLIVDHGVVKEQKDVSSKLLELINNDAFFWDNAVKVLRFFNKEIKEHFNIEEQVLFPFLKKVVTENASDLVAEIEKEHQPIIKLLTELEKISMQHNRYPSKSTREAFVKVCEEILDLLMPHSKREDDEIFPLIRQAFKEADYKELESLYFKYMEI